MKNKNCVITIKQTSGKHVTTRVYKLDDYRVATAICNILDNVAEVDKNLNVNFISARYYSGTIGVDVEVDTKAGEQNV